MKTRNKTTLELCDIWADEKATDKRKSHPSTKRSKSLALPHPGQSYNPDPKDHKRLLAKIEKQELKFQKKQKAIESAVRAKISKDEVRRDEKKELVSGIEHLIKEANPKAKIEGYESDASSATDGAFSDYDDNDFKAIVKDKVVVEKRKSKQQRLKQVRDKLQRNAAKLKKLKNIRLAKFDGIRKINKELEKKERELAGKRKTHKKIKDERLGQRFEPSDPIYCLSSELPKNLRDTSCPMDRIVREQLESFQSRLLVEPTSYQVPKRKYKRPKFERKVAAEQEG